MNLIINSLFVLRIVMFGSVLRDSLPKSKKVVRRESVFLKQFTVKIINTKEGATFILWTKDSGGKYELDSTSQPQLHKGFMFLAK